MAKTKKVEPAVDKSAVTAEEKIVQISGDIKSFEKKQLKIVAISDDLSLDNANKFLIEIKGRINRIEEIKKEYVNPLKEDLKSLKENIARIESMFDTPKNNYVQIEYAVKRAIGDYRLLLDRKIKEEEERLRKEQEAEAARIAEQNKKEIEKSKKTGEAPKIEPVFQAPISIERKEKTLKTESGSSTSKKVIKFEITDYTKLPKMYKDLILARANEKELDRQIIKKFVDMTGMKTNIDGVRVYEDYEVSVKA